LLLAAALVLAISRRLAWPLRWKMLSVLLVPLTLSGIYSPASTAALERWLAAQLPAAIALAPKGSPAAAAVAVIPGRGPLIAAATTARAAELISQQRAAAVYVSGDARSTADHLLELGVPADRVAGDSCARTTWDNASRTAVWLRDHHPGVPVLLISDPWQLPPGQRCLSAPGAHGDPDPGCSTALRPIPQSISPARNRRHPAVQVAGAQLTALKPSSIQWARCDHH
jgi:uncharacterized SAM-binding protein YcdF (DUF218 family)